MSTKRCSHNNNLEIVLMAILCGNHHEQISVVLACLQMAEKVHLKLWAKLRCSL